MYSIHHCILFLFGRVKFAGVIEIIPFEGTLHKNKGLHKGLHKNIIIFVLACSLTFSKL